MTRKGETSTTLETARKHQKIIRLRLNGVTTSEIADEVGMTERGVRKVWERWRDSDRAALLDEDPVEVVQEHLAGFRQLRADAARVFDEAAGFTIPAEDGKREVHVAGNASARVGALRLVADLRQREVALRQETGLLPKNLGQMQVVIDVRNWTEKVIRIFERNNLGEDAWGELLEMLEQDPRVKAAIGAGTGPGTN